MLITGCAQLAALTIDKSRGFHIYAIEGKCPQVETAREHGWCAFDGFGLLWLRSQRGGIISETVEVTLSRDNKKCTIALILPYNDNETKQKILNQALEHFVAELRTAGLFSSTKLPSRASCRALLLAGLERERTVVQVDGTPRLVGQDNVLPGTPIEENYTGDLRTRKEVLIEYLGGVFLVVAGFMSAACGVMLICRDSRAGHTIVAITQMSLACFFLFVFVWDLIWLPWDSILGPLSLLGIFSFGFSPIMIYLAYAYTKARHAECQLCEDVADNTCDNCGYILKGLSSLRCPECGMKISAKDYP